MTSCSRHGATRNQWEATESATRVVPEVDSSPPSTKSHEGEKLEKFQARYGGKCRR